MQAECERNRVLAVGALLLTVGFGLALRRFGYVAGFSFVIVKYGGSILWGAMVYWFFAMVFIRLRGLKVAAVALIVAVAVELFRLWHTPALDAFRLTTAGALLLGRVFSLWNVLAYAVGIASALAIDRVLSRVSRAA
ncbi:ribosomal maturation YjgA family protein [Rhizobium sp. LEGMi12c]